MSESDRNWQRYTLLILLKIVLIQVRLGQECLPIVIKLEKKRNQVGLAPSFSQSSTPLSIFG